MKCIEPEKGYNHIRSVKKVLLLHIIWIFKEYYSL